jgi:hypothetical protein
LSKDQTNAAYYYPLAKAAVDSKMPQWIKYGYYAAQRAFMAHESRDTSLLYGKACLGTGKPGITARVLAKYCSEKYKDPECLMVQAIAFREMGDHAKEQAVLAQALQLDPKILRLANTFYVSRSTVPSLEQANAREKQAAEKNSEGTNKTEATPDKPNTPETAPATTQPAPAPVKQETVAPAKPANKL